MPADFAAESIDELAAREQAHRVMADLHRHRELGSALTDQLARKTHEVDHLQAQLDMTAAGTSGLTHLADCLRKYEEELGAERTRSLTMEHEILVLRAEVEARGLPAPHQKQQYEDEVRDLRSRVEEQDTALAALRARADDEQRAERHDVEHRALQSQVLETEALQHEVDTLRSQLREKRSVTKELQDMLKAHLRHNAEVRCRTELRQPRWLHPLVRGATLHSGERSPDGA